MGTIVTFAAEIYRGKTRYFEATLPDHTDAYHDAVLAVIDALTDGRAELIYQTSDAERTSRSKTFSVRELSNRHTTTDTTN